MGTEDCKKTQVKSHKSLNRMGQANSTTLCRRPDDLCLEMDSPRRRSRTLMADDDTIRWPRPPIHSKFIIWTIWFQFFKKNFMSFSLRIVTVFGSFIWSNWHFGALWDSLLAFWSGGSFSGMFHSFIHSFIQVLGFRSWIGWKNASLSLSLSLSLSQIFGL